MILTNPYAALEGSAVPTTLDNTLYPITPIMQKWYKEKVVLRVVQELQHCYILGDGRHTQRVQKDMVTEEI